MTTLTGIISLPSWVWLLLGIGYLVCLSWIWGLIKAAGRAEGKANYHQRLLEEYLAWDERRKSKASVGEALRESNSLSEIEDREQCRFCRGAGHDA